MKAAPYVDHDVLSAFAGGVRDGLDWIQKHGVRIQQTTFPTIPPFPSLTSIHGGGLAMVETLSAAVEARGGTILYETTATGLVRGERGEIGGVRVSHDGKARSIVASAVVLASGGFEGNAEMMTQYLGRSARHYRPIARGGYYNKGEGIRMALDAGAAPAGDFGGSHHEPVDPRSLPEAMISAFPLGIVVNQRGERFIDEASSDIAYSQEEPCKAIGRQPGGIGYFLYDSKIDEVPNWRTLIRSAHPPIEAPTLHELAVKLKIPPVRLEQTVHDCRRDGHAF